MKFIADLHVHTVASGHSYNTIYEYASYAKKIGLKYIGMTDHGPGMAGGPHLYHFQNLRCLPEKIDGVRVLKGVEANIMDHEGNLDIPVDTQKDMELIIASFHLHLGYDGSDERKNTDALLKVIANPKVNILGHPGNPQFPVDMDAMIEACIKHRVIPEINNSSFTGVVRPGSYSRCVEIAKKVRKAGWKVIFGSDAHCRDTLARFDRALDLAKEAGLKPEDIVNTNVKMLEDYVVNK